MNLTFALAASVHFAAGEFNDLHPGVRLEFDGGAAVSAYLNSQDRLSLAVSHVWEDGPFWAEASLVTGYERMRIAPLVRFGIQRENTRLFVLPFPERGGGLGLVMGIEITFGGD